MITFPENHIFAFGESTYPNGGRFGPLRRSYFSFMALKKGKIEIVCDDISMTLNEGQCAVLYNKEYLDYVYPAGIFTHVLWCECGELITAEDPSLYLKSLSKALPTSSRIETIWKLGHDLGHAGGLNRAILRNSLGRSIFYEYFEEAGLVEKEEPLPKSVVKAKRYLDEHFQDKCNLDSVAEIAGVSPPYLSKIFKEHLKISPTQYLWELRISKGTNLLRATGCSVSEIAYRCGYQNPYHFSRHIKQKFGCSPSALRKRKDSKDLSPISQVQEEVDDIQF